MQFYFEVEVDLWTLDYPVNAQITFVASEDYVGCGEFSKRIFEVCITDLKLFTLQGERTSFGPRTMKDIEKFCQRKADEHFISSREAA